MHLDKAEDWKSDNFGKQDTLQMQKFLQQTPDLAEQSLVDLPGSQSPVKSEVCFVVTRNLKI